MSKILLDGLAHVALAHVAGKNGKRWKAKLRQAWAEDKLWSVCDSKGYERTLRELKDKLGPLGLARYRFPGAEPSAPAGKTLVEVFAAEEQRKEAHARGELDLSAPMRSLRELRGVNARTFAELRGVTEGTQSEAERKGPRVILQTLIDAARAAGKKLKIVVENIE